MTEHEAAVLCRVMIYPGGRLESLNDGGHYVGDEFSNSDACKFLLKHGPCSEPSYEDEFDPCWGSSLWSEDQIKLLKRENEGRKSKIDRWRSQAEEVAKLLSGTAACVACANASVDWDDKKFAPVGAFFAIPKSRIDALKGFCRSIIDKVKDSALEFEIVSGAISFFTTETLVNFQTGAMPEDGEMSLSYAKRVSMDEARFDAIMDAHRRSNGNHVLFDAIIKNTTDAGKIEFAIKGLLPRGVVSLLIGPAKSGKSSIALQMLGCIASGSPFAGLKAEPKESAAYSVFLSGEDPREVLAETFQLMGFDTPIGSTLLLSGDPLQQALKMLETENVNVFIVDTAAAFIDGSVNDGGPARELMGSLAKFAMRKNCAVLVIHHTNKGKSPKGAKATLEAMKGSSEFTSAARVNLTFHADGDRRYLAVAQRNMPVSMSMLKTPLCLSFDGSTGRHEPEASAEGEGVCHEAGIHDDARIVAAVVDRVRSSGRPVALSGKNEPYYLQPPAPELAGWGRARVRKAHMQAISEGLLAAE